MIGRIHYSKHNHIKVVSNGRCYYTDLMVSKCPYANRQLVLFDIVDESMSLAGNIRET